MQFGRQGWPPGSTDVEDEDDDGVVVSSLSGAGSVSALAAGTVSKTAHATTVHIKARRLFILPPRTGT